VDLGVARFFVAERRRAEVQATEIISWHNAKAAQAFAKAIADADAFS
jgi:hypothetical protein